VGPERAAGRADLVFRVLADPTRRRLLDLLHESNGQTLGQLCAPLDMARQSATQHLALLEAANLITTVKRGREKLHYLNPVPIHEIQRRWIGKFEQPRLAALADIKRQAEGNHPMPSKPDYVYVTYIEATPVQVWHALTDADLTAAYWGHSNVSDWRDGCTLSSASSRWPATTPGNTDRIWSAARSAASSVVLTNDDPLTRCPATPASSSPCRRSPADISGLVLSR
jgi:DNA-binding transcriptional ArsR family regulator